MDQFCKDYKPPKGTRIFESYTTETALEDATLVYDRLEPYEGIPLPDREDYIRECVEDWVSSGQPRTVIVESGPDHGALTGD